MQNPPAGDPVEKRVFRRTEPAARGQRVRRVSGSGGAVGQENALPKVLEIAISESNSFQNFDLVVAAFGESVRV